MTDTTILAEAIETRLQRDDLGSKPIYLYIIDLAKFDEAPFFLVRGQEGSNQIVTFDGQDYTPWDISMEGLEKTVSGPFPRPTFTVANVTGIFDPYMSQFNNLQGAIVKRVPTFPEHLDDGTDPDPNSTLPIEEYEIVQCVKDDGEVIAWELAASVDVEDEGVPTETANKTYCRKSYPVPDPDNPGEYLTVGVTCPYRGENGYFDTDGNVTLDPLADKCNKLLTKGCIVRFTRAVELPFDAAPGMLQIRAT